MPGCWPCNLREGNSLDAQCMNVAKTSKEEGTPELWHSFLGAQEGNLHYLQTYGIATVMSAGDSRSICRIFGLRSETVHRRIHVLSLCGS